MEKDYILRTKIESMISSEELKTIIDFIQDIAHQNRHRRELILLFFINLKKKVNVKSSKYLILSFCNLYNIDIELVINNKDLIKFIKEEEKSTKSIFLTLF